MTTIPSEERLDRWSAWSDRLNPILVREIVQAVRGRAFPLTVLGALAICVVIAITVASGGEANESAGRNAFSAGLATLAPLLLFVVPMQAYQSMRLELGRGIVEQLFLSRLRPRSIVLGKLLAATVQFVLYVSVIAPLLATSYLLRGVDLPTIALSLAFAFVFNLAATAAAISAAAQAIFPAMQGFANVAIAFGLGMMTCVTMVMIASGEYLRELGQLMRSAEFGMVTALAIAGAVTGTVLSSLTAQTFLLHAYENRSTGFRVFLFAIVALAFGWMLTFVDAAMWSDVTYGLLLFLVLFGTVFGIFMVTEQRELSPRVRAHVPQNQLAALAMVPLLPGRDRGMAAVLLYFAVLGGIHALAWRLLAVPAFGVMAARGAQLSLWAGVYGLAWVSIAKLLRSRLPATVQGNYIARFLMPVLFVVGMLAPVLLDVFTQGRVRGWHVGHVVNPFWTIDHCVFRSGPALGTSSLLLVGIGLVVLQIPACVRGIREVLAASAARRARPASLPPSSPAATEVVSAG